LFKIHAAGFQHSPSPPKLSEVAGLGKIFGLPKSRVTECAEMVYAVGKQWHELAEKNGVDEEEIDLIYSFFNF
jgi:hypothetical protein